MTARRLLCLLAIAALAVLSAVAGEREVFSRVYDDDWREMGEVDYRRDVIDTSTGKRTGTVDRNGRFRKLNLFQRLYDWVVNPDYNERMEKDDYKARCEPSWFSFERWFGKSNPLCESPEGYPNLREEYYSPEHRKLLRQIGKQEATAQPLTFSQEYVHANAFAPEPEGETETKARKPKHERALRKCARAAAMPDPDDDSYEWCEDVCDGRPVLPKDTANVVYFTCQRCGHVVRRQARKAKRMERKWLRQGKECTWLGDSFSIQQAQSVE